jgi:hypothetical protein
MGLAERIAVRFKQAGASGFFDYIQNPDVKAAFREAVDDARHEHGHGGYSGTIAEKDGYEIRRREPMSREQASEFADQDQGKNDTWGPAFAVPVAESKRVAEKKFKVKVTARDDRAAYEPAEKAVKEKYATPGAHTGIKVEKVTRVKEGKLPEMTIAKNGPEGFKLVGPGTKAMHEGWRAAKNFGSRGEAVTALKEFILQRKPATGDTYEIVKYKTTDIFTIGDTTKSLHLYEVEGTVTVEKASDKIIGWLFYGYASS